MHTVMNMEFHLFAPRITSVTLVGSWLPEPMPMTKDRLGNWRIDIKVPDGRHTYQFQLPSRSPFLDNKTIHVTDPMARMVDQGKGVIIIQNGTDVTISYTWRHDAVTMPQNNELIIYELHVAEFGAQGKDLGTFASVTQRLDYLRDMGITAIELMPVTSFPEKHAWGYNVCFPCATDTSYGTPQELMALIDACHERGIRVILDVVFNHADVNAPLTQMDFYYWFRDDREGEKSFGPKYDYEAYDADLDIIPATAFNLAVARYWLRQYHIDGFRLDAAAILDNDDFLFALRQLHQQECRHKPFYMVAEFLPENPSVAGSQGPADGAWHQRFEFAIENAVISNGENSRELLQSLQPGNHGYTNPDLAVNYIESHDERSLMEKLSQQHITGLAAQQKMKLAATLLFTAVGIPMIYQGQEFGGYRTHTEEVRPLQWYLPKHSYAQELQNHYAFLAQLRLQYSAFRSPELIVLYDRDGVIAYQRGNGTGATIVIVHLRDIVASFALTIPSGQWHDAVSGQTFAVDGVFRGRLGASSAMILVPAVKLDT